MAPKIYYSTLLFIASIGVVIYTGSEVICSSSTSDKHIINYIKSSQSNQCEYHEIKNYNKTYQSNESGVNFKPATNLRVKYDIYRNDQMDNVYELFYDRGISLNQEKKVSSFIYDMLVARFHSVVYSDTIIHRYDTFSELKQSSGPNINNEQCLKYLEDLNNRANLMVKQQFESQDINLYHLLDTYGRFQSGLFSGSLVWAGMYDECLGLQINTPEGKKPGRYCWASIMHKSWPKGSTYNEMLNLKLGICLPSACDSLKYKNKFELIQNLMNFNERRVDWNQFTLNNLYCLPDQESQSRSLWKSPKALQAIVLLTIWVAIVIYATVKYELITRKKSRILKDEQIIDEFSNNTMDQKKTKDEANIVPECQYYNIYRLFAITNNLKQLLDTTKVSTLISDKPEEVPKTEQKKENVDYKVVDLRCLEGIKVICMSYVIMGHILMYLGGDLSNGLEMATILSPAFFLANLMPAFAVNSFFTITGLLTCYLLFKQNQIQSLINNPLRWLAFIGFRYLRIMPMYAIVVYYCKYLGKFSGSGPMWDYGTSSLGHRRQCEDESWLWTLLFGANFKPPMEHCIQSAWYLANDFQYFLVTPIFMFALYKSPSFGQKLLQFCIVAGYLAGFLSIFLTDATDLRPVAKFMQHGFKTYITFLSPSYTRPFYRIAPYLCGLLFGYKLHIYEQTKLKCLQASKANNPSKLDLPFDWPNWFQCHGMKLSFLFVIVCAITPVVGANLPFSRFYAQLAVALFMSTYHILFAMAIGFYILLASTNHGNQYINECLSAPIWKPLSRLSLCVVLINIEVVGYIIQSHRQQTQMNFLVQCATNLLGIVATYLVATLVCVLFEAPIRSALNQFLTSLTGNKKFNAKKQS